MRSGGIGGWEDRCCGHSGARGGYVLFARLCQSRRHGCGGGGSCDGSIEVIVVDEAKQKLVWARVGMLRLAWTSFFVLA